MAGHDARQLGARLRSSRDGFIAKNKLGSSRSSRPLHAQHAVGLGVVPRRQVIHQGVAHDGFGALDVRNVAGIAKEPRLLEKVRSLLPAQVDVDLLQVSGAVMTGDAGQIHAQEDPAVENGQLVVGVDLMDLSEVVWALLLSRLTFDVLAHDGIYRRHHEVTLGRTRDQGAGEIVVGPIRCQTFFQHVVEQIDPAAHLSVGADQVHIEVRPLVHKGRAADQLVNQLGSLIRRVPG